MELTVDLLDLAVAAPVAAAVTPTTSPADRGAEEAEDQQEEEQREEQAEEAEAHSPLRSVPVVGRNTGNAGCRRRKLGRDVLRDADLVADHADDGEQDEGEDRTSCTHVTSPFDASSACRAAMNEM